MDNKIATVVWNEFIAQTANNGINFSFTDLEKRIKETIDEALSQPPVSGMLLDEATQNECWFQIANTVEDMSDNTTWDEVIEHLKLNYMVVPRNYR